MLLVKIYHNKLNLHRILINTLIYRHLNLEDLKSSFFLLQFSLFVLVAHLIDETNFICLTLNVFLFKVLFLSCLNNFNLEDIFHLHY